MSAWRHMRAVALLPAMTTVAIPAMIVGKTRDIAPGWKARLPIAAMLLATGLSLMVSTIRLFSTQGLGTLAPWDETQRLVVQGPYRHVRNPMISGVLFVLLAETTATGSRALLAWAATFFVANAIYMPLMEERGLEQRFGDEYRAYKANVPRWLPRLTPWQPDAQDAMLA